MAYQDVCEKISDYIASLKMDGQSPSCMSYDEVGSICMACGFNIGVFVPGTPCPHCGEPLL